MAVRSGGSSKAWRWGDLHGFAWNWTLPNSSLRVPGSAGPQSRSRKGASSSDKITAPCDLITVKVGTLPYVNLSTDERMAEACTMMIREMSQYDVRNMIQHTQ